MRSTNLITIESTAVETRLAAVGAEGNSLRAFAVVVSDIDIVKAEVVCVDTKCATGVI
jgi:hypothetical protein